MLTEHRRHVDALEALGVHEFVGRLDRWCETCNKPDRDPIHTSLRTPPELQALLLPGD